MTTRAYEPLEEREQLVMGEEEEFHNKCELIRILSRPRIDCQGLTQESGDDGEVESPKPREEGAQQVVEQERRVEGKQQQSQLGRIM